jgi:hypothetical protein
MNQCRSKLESSGEIQQNLPSPVTNGRCQRLRQTHAQTDGLLGRHIAEGHALHTRCSFLYYYYYYYYYYYIKNAYILFS